MQYLLIFIYKNLELFKQRKLLILNKTIIKELELQIRSLIMI